MEPSIKLNQEESSPANASMVLKGKTLVGARAGAKWLVSKRLERHPNATGGTFSIGYEVLDHDGQTAFMKATDIGLLIKGGSGNLLDNLAQASFEHKFERSILDICHGNNMDKIVRCLDYGDFPIVHNGVQDAVFFIIFEKAHGDVRTQITADQKGDLAWSMTALHNLATAISQLHQADIAHNDIKPSNLLVFGEKLQKLADMGRATGNTIPGPFDQLHCPGQNTYGAPEQLYRYYPKVGVNWNYRKASDLYLLGSMLHYFVTGTMLTPFISTCLRPAHLPPNWTGFYHDLLPFWREGFGAALENFKRCLPTGDSKRIKEINEKLTEAFKQLCEPDPEVRGHPSLQTGTSGNRYSVEKYVSLFDLLRIKAQV